MSGPLSVVVDTETLRELVSAAKEVEQRFPGPEVEALMLPIRELTVHLTIADPPE